MAIILGIDPGSRITGYGVIRIESRKPVYLGSGCIRTGSGPLPERLQKIFEGVTQLIKMYSPSLFAIEQVFMARNPDSALKLVMRVAALLLLQLSLICRSMNMPRVR